MKVGGRGLVVTLRDMTKIDFLFRDSRNFYLLYFYSILMHVNVGIGIPTNHIYNVIK